ncbi:hypothetical protein [Streptomyces sp. NPDC002530]
MPAVLAVAGWHWSRYPGKWRFAFSSAYARERAELRRCRRELGEVTREDRQAEKTAKEQADRAEAAYQQSVRELEKEIETL